MKNKKPNSIFDLFKLNKKTYGIVCSDNMYKADAKAMREFNKQKFKFVQEVGDRLHSLDYVVGSRKLLDPCQVEAIVLKHYALAEKIKRLETKLLEIKKKYYHDTNQ
jgi:hypothetical protein